jgi:hypothetical protein
LWRFAFVGAVPGAIALNIRTFETQYPKGENLTMPKSNILITLLVLTNVISGVALWRSQQQVQYQVQKAQAITDVLVNQSKENIRLRKVIGSQDPSAKPRVMKQLSLIGI